MTEVNGDISKCEGKKKWSGVILEVSGRPYLHPQHSQACALASDGMQANAVSLAAWFYTDKGKARSFSSSHFYLYGANSQQKLSLINMMMFYL